MTDKEDFETLATRFHEDTGMLPIGKSESAAAVRQANFTRNEVRRLLWDLWLSAHRRLAELNDQLRATHAGTLGEAMNLEGEVLRLQAIVDALPKCWRLNEAGELVRDKPVTPGMTLFWSPGHGDEIVSFIADLVGTYTAHPSGMPGYRISGCCDTIEAAQAARDKP